jgi:segregation and condensation protein B
MTDLMTDENLISKIEAILLVSDEPISAKSLAKSLTTTEDKISTAIESRVEFYKENSFGFTISQIAGGFRFETLSELDDFVVKFVTQDQPSKLSPAALETLAIVAYRQPISRAQISAIRGVNADGVMKLLIQRGYVEEVGRDVGIGQALLFGTSNLFLEKMGLNSLDDLPSLSDFIPDATEVEALEQILKPAFDE